MAHELLSCITRVASRGFHICGLPSEAMPAEIDASGLSIPPTLEHQLSFSHSHVEVNPSIKDSPDSGSDHHNNLTWPSQH